MLHILISGGCWSNRKNNKQKTYSYETDNQDNSMSLFQKSVIQIRGLGCPHKTSLILCVMGVDFASFYDFDI
jgi:hypothetical protein